jgi:hypothetical protein
MKKNAVTPKPFMSALEMQMRVKAIREELEARHKTGISKMAAADGNPVSTEALQNEMFSLIYRLSQLE